MRLTLCLDPLATHAVDAVVRVARPTITTIGEHDPLAEAGPEALEACHELARLAFPRGLAVGQATSTTAGDLPARWLVHVVPPRYDLRANHEYLLAQSYRAVLDVAGGLGALTLALPALGLGGPYWPLDVVLRITTGTLLNTPTSVREAHLVMRTPQALERFAEAIARG